MFLGQTAIHLSRRIDTTLCAWSTELGKGEIVFGNTRVVDFSGQGRPSPMLQRPGIRCFFVFRQPDKASFCHVFFAITTRGLRLTKSSNEYLAAGVGEARPRFGVRSHSGVMLSLSCFDIGEEGQQSRSNFQKLFSRRVASVLC